jgi:hypothetical protein
LVRKRDSPKSATTARPWRLGAGGACLLVDQDVVRVEIPVNDRLGQGVEVVQAPGHVMADPQLL